MLFVSPLQRGARVMCQSTGPRINGFVVGHKVVMSRGKEKPCGTMTELPWHRIYVVMDKVRGRVLEVSEDWVFPTASNNDDRVEVAS